MPHRPWPILILATPVLLLACSSSPTTANKNVPLIDARASFKASDFDAALRNLDKAIKFAPDDAARQQATVLRIALVTALADANKQMAEAYSTGAKQPSAQGQTGPFLKLRSDYYNNANSSLMDAMQSVMNQRAKLSDAPMAVEITFPGFTGTNPGLNKIKSGRLVSDSERMNTELQADRNALALVLSAISGAGQDPNKGQHVFGDGKADIDPRVYLIELSNSFQQTGAMYESRGLNQPDHVRTVGEVVGGNLDVVTKMLAAKPDKDVEARVKKMQADREKALKKPAK